MNNKKFLVGAVLLAVAVFATIFFLNKNQPEQATAPTANNDLLIKFHSPIVGEANAPVTIVEFLDPECEACRAMHPMVKQLLNEYAGKVRLVVRYMPYHKNSKYAASVLEEAREFNRYNEALDLMFQHQPAWGDHHNPQPQLIPTYLKDLNIPIENLQPETVIAKHGAKIEIDRQDGEALGVQGTPTFFVNGVKLPQIGYSVLKEAIDKALQ